MKFDRALSKRYAPRKGVNIEAERLEDGGIVFVRAYRTKTGSTIAGATLQPSGSWSILVEEGTLGATETGLTFEDAMDRLARLAEDTIPHPFRLLERCDGATVIYYGDDDETYITKPEEGSSGRWSVSVVSMHSGEGYGLLRLPITSRAGAVAAAIAQGRPADQFDRLQAAREVAS